METVIVDEQDKHLLREYNWRIDNKGYVVSYKRTGWGKTSCYLGYVSLARLIMGVTGLNIIVHHINKNPLDNRRCNLAVLTRGDHGNFHNKQNKQKRDHQKRLCARTARVA